MTATNDGIINLKGRIRDGKLVALLDHEGKELGAPVTSIENEFTGRIKKLTVEGKDALAEIALEEKDRPIMCIGGDHPYRQWYGTNGKNGMFGVYADNKLPVYDAICWDTSLTSSGAGSTFSDVNGAVNGEQMTTAEALTLQAAGLEYLAHGTRHPNKWDQLNSGIRIDYHGVAASATVLINGNGTNATEIVFVGNGGAENTTLTLSSYATLALLKAAIDAIAGGSIWVCEIAPELAGTEDPKWLWPISAARTVTGGTTPFDNRRFCISGGIYVLHSGTTHRYATLKIESAGATKIFLDGCRAASYNPTTQTINTMLSALITAIGTFGSTASDGTTAADVTIRALRNGKQDGGVAVRESYMQGDELATYLTRGIYDCTGRAALATYGLPMQYIVKRQVQNLLDKAGAAGINITGFAQAGSNFPPHLIPDIPQISEWRLDPSVGMGFGVNNPFAMPANRDMQWHPMTAADQITGAELKSSIDALCDSGSFAADYLIHDVIPDGTTGYQFPGYTPSAGNISEADFVDAIRHLGEKNSGGLVDVVSYREFAALRRTRAAPKNLVFNPRFKNRETYSGDPILGAISNGWAIPGWQSNFQSGAGKFSAVSVSDGELSFTTNGAIGTGGYVLRQGMWLEEGKRYDIGFDVDPSGLTAGSIQIAMRTIRLMPNGTLAQSSLPGMLGKIAYPGGPATLNMRFTKDMVRDWTPERVMSKSGTFNLTSSPAHIKLNLYGVGLTADINIAGVTPTATTAKEIATAINAAMATDAAYAARPELHNIAKAVGTRVILEPTFRNLDPNATGLAVINGTTNGPCTAVFGSTEVQSNGSNVGVWDSGICQYMLEVFVATGTNGTAKLMRPYCREVQSA